MKMVNYPYKTTIQANLSTASYTSDKLEPHSISTLMGKPGDIMAIDENGMAVWKSLDDDKEMREKYSNMQVAWERNT